MKDVVLPQKVSPHVHQPSLAHANQLIKKALLSKNQDKFFKNLCSVIDFIEKEPHFANLCWKWERDQRELKDKKLLIQYREPFKMIKDTSLAGKCPGMCPE